MAEASTILQIHTAFFSPHLTLNPRYSHSYPSLCLKRSVRPIQCSSSVSTSQTKPTNNSSNNAAQTQEVPWGCDIDSLENSEDLQKWLSDSGLPPQKMGIDKVEVGERGLVALKNIRKGEKLLFVPPSLFITADSVSY